LDNEYNLYPMGSEYNPYPLGTHLVGMFNIQLSDLQLTLGRKLLAQQDQLLGPMLIIHSILRQQILKMQIVYMD